MLNTFNISDLTKKQVVEAKNGVSKNVLVSVCIQTFNHGNYIKACLDGMLIQQTDFEFEILLGEDASTDATRKICIEYAEKHPDKIRLFLHHRENNIKVGGNPTGRFNFLYNLSKAQGKYVAICEGDDYWTDPLKLQKQVDILEADSSIAMVYSDAATITDGTLGAFYKEDQRPKGVFNLHKYLYEFQVFGVPTCTSMLRADVMKAAQSFLFRHADKVISADFAMWAIAGKFGNYHFLEDKTAVRRKHSTGIMGTLGGTRAWFEAGIHLNHALAKELGPSTHASFYDGDWWYYMELSFWDLKEKKWGHSVRHLAKSLLAAGRSSKNNRIQILRDYFYRLRQGFSGKN